MKPFGNGSRFRRAANWLAGSAFALLLATPLPSYAAPSALAINCDATSLRNAITTANSAGPGATVELPTNCVFTLPDGLYDGPGPTGLPVITGDVTLVGNGSTIQRDPAATTNFRLFWISNGAKLQLSNITLKNGLARGGDGGSTNNASGGGGGGIGLAGGNSLGKAGGGGGSFGAGGNGDATNGGAGGVGVRNGGQAGTGTSSGVGNNGGGGATRGRGGAGGFGGGGGGGTGGSVGGPGGTGGFGAGGGGGGGAFGFFLGSGAAGFGGGNGGAGTGNAIGGGGGGGGGLGGAIFIENGGALRLANTTLDGNQAVGGNGGSGTPTTSGAGGNGGSGYGGAIFNAGTYCDANGNTFVNNAVVAGTGGLGEVNGSNGSIGGQNIYHYSGFGQGLTSCTAFLAPEINVLGNGTSIVSGATTPSTADQSDFGSVSISNRIVVRTFTIQNTGTAALTVSTPTLSGTNAGDFAVTSLPASSVAVGGSTTFQITFDPTAVGTRTATVSIGNNDSNENPYTFALQGVGTLPTPNLSIPNGQRDAAQGSFSVPVNFASDGASIASLAFSLDYDENCLSFDGADANNDGIPDALTGLPSGFVASISYNANDTTGELDISLFDSSVPIGALSDGALFTVAFNVKPACVTTDGSLRNVTVNFSNTPAPSFSDATAKDVNGTSSGATIPLHFNAAPTALNLSNSSVAENAASGTTVGTLSTVDPDAGDTHTYALVTGTGDTDNASFTLANGVLKTAAVFDFETKSSYSVRIRTTDNGGLNGTFEQSFTINVTNVNEVPTVLSLDHTNVDENLPAGTTVGTFSTTDPDAGDSHTYALVTGTGDMDNASFTLANGVLKTAASFNYESKASYSIRVRTTDSGNLWLEQTFTINVNNVNDAPVAVNDPNDPTATIFVAGQATVIDVLANDTDEDHNPLSVSSLDTAGMQGSVTNNTSNVSYTAPEANGSSSFTYQASDGLLTSNSATVNVTYVKNDLRGDCNANGAVSAADFVATVLEIFDTNDTTYNNHPAWWLTYTGDYAGSPRGCDANASQNGPNYTTDSVGAGDLICTVLIFFRAPCGSNQVVAADAVVPAQINVVAAEVQPGQIARVTVNLDPANHSVAAAAFALQIDPTKLGFDPADADGDGIPDAVVLNIPANMSKSVQWNAAHNRLEVAVFGTTLPLPTLNNGALATVNFQVAASATAGTTEVGLQLVSLGDTAGQDVAVEQSNGTVNITGQAASTLLYLPVIVR